MTTTPTGLTTLKFEELGYYMPQHPEFTPEQMVQGFNDTSLHYRTTVEELATALHGHKRRAFDAVSGASTVAGIANKLQLVSPGWEKAFPARDSKPQEPSAPREEPPRENAYAEIAPLDSVDNPFSKEGGLLR